MIQCKRVYEASAASDGYRILVDRLWPRGVRKTSLNYDEWCKALAPSSTLRSAWHSEQIDFETFSKEYAQELDKVPDETRRIADIATGKTLTLLYAAKNTEQNHALVLADYLNHLPDQQAK
ncbi:MarR family transcriptional regulator [Salmonella enterica subsp. enterica serovar Choleraesuis]|nr:MarR family transcriptional regulator [Salmonella enterica subsp. enterica serovar Choleraesuis]